MLNLQNSLNGALESFNPANEPEVDQETINRFTAHYKERFTHYGYDNREPYNFNAIARYCALLYAGNMKKGLCLVGDAGRGKTFAFRIMENLFRLRMFSSIELKSRYKVLGDAKRQALYDEMKGNYSNRNQPAIDCLWKDCCIDDIGTETTIVDYGEREECIDTIVQHRSREFEISGARTHMSFNILLEPLKDAQGNQLSPKGESAQERYGARFVSRVHQMCFVIVLRGNDRRRD